MLGGGVRPGHLLSRRVIKTPNQSGFFYCLASGTTFDQLENVDRVVGNRRDSLPPALHSAGVVGNAQPRGASTQAQVLAGPLWVPRTLELVPDFAGTIATAAAVVDAGTAHGGTLQSARYAEGGEMMP